MQETNDMMLVLNQPGTWLVLLLDLVIALGALRIGLNLLEVLDGRIHRRLLRSARALLSLGVLYALIAVVARVIEWPVHPLYVHGEAIADWFREAAGRVLAVLVLATIAWNMVNVAAAHLVPATEFTRASVRVQTLKGVLESSLRALIVVVSLITILDNIGIQTSTLLAGVSVLGLAVSFGAQSLIKDVITGFFILLEDQYGVGDVVTVNNGTLTGGVEMMNLRITVLRALDGTVHIIPNGQITSVSVMSKEWSRVVAIATLPPTADVNQALELLRSVAQDLYADPAWRPKFLEEPQIDGVTNFTKDGFEVRALFKVLPKEQWPTGREFNRRMKMALDEAGLGGLRPQLMVVRQDETANNPYAPVTPKPA